jgi:hypothetical protein
MRYFLRFLFIFLSLLTGATFLYSAYTKTDPIQPFEYTMVEYLHMPWLLAAVAARFFIGLEAALGALIALHLFGKNKWVLKTALALLAIFSVYLVALWAREGNNINCGCFGDYIWMSPAASLVKNLVIMLVIWLLMRFHSGFAGKWPNYGSWGVLAVLIILPFFLYYIPMEHPSWLKKDKYHVDLTPLYSGNKQPTVDLSKGKHIIAFVSASCPHCHIAAYKMHVMKKSNPNIPFFLVIGGAAELSEFWKKTKADNIPYSRLAKEPFLDFTGGRFPLILWVNNGWVEANANYNTLNQGQIEQWMNAPEQQVPADSVQTSLH